MTIKIELQKPEIDVEIGGLQFKYDYSDKSLEDASREAQDVLKQVKALNDDSKVEEIKQQLKRGFDLYLGDGAFDQIFKLNPSSFELASVFVTLHNKLEDELESRGEKIRKSQQERAKKYNKKKK
ncbi:hypothetical protein [Bacillus sp. JCM 19041]|uniref:hypothetical protein n=1 Tax=Bacillus sp. JCM 19041 TaxID=1460637 RepID=UPI0006D1DADA